MYNPELLNLRHSKSNSAPADSTLPADEARIRSVLESISDGFFAVDSQWRFTYVNNQAERVLGRMAGDLLGRIIWEEYPGLRGGEFEGAYLRAARERIPVSVTSFYPDHDRWYEIHAYPAADGISVYFRDVTEQKRSEERWRELAERYGQQSRIFDRVLSSITDFAYTFDLQGRFTFINRPLLDLWGLTLEQAVGKNFFDLQYPHPLASTLQRQIQQVIQTRQRIVDETPYTSPTGAGGFYQYIFSPVIGPDGHVEAVAGSTRDITAHRQAANEALAAAEANAKFRTFFEQGTYFAGVMNLDGTIIEANRLCLDACGFTREQVIGRKFWDCGWWTPRPALVEMIRTGVAQAVTGEPFRCETPYFIADGSERFVDLTLAPVTDSAGRVLFVAPTGIDITDRKNLADERERLLAAERAARAEAESANRAKDKFLAVLSHELRTPLSPVVMTIPAIEADTDLPEKFRDELAMVRRNIELEVKLIDDLLDLSRITSGKLRLHMQPVHVHEILEHAMHNSMTDASGKRLNIHHELNATADLVNADPARLQQVFWNLLRNAIKFTSDDGEIFVRTWNDSEQHVHVEIRDTGIGIDRDLLPRIFDAFEQGDNRMTRQFGGLGLGLAIAKAVVEMHGGAINAASRGRDQGAAFSVQLNTAVPNPELSPGNNSGHLSPQSRSHVRVLLVEDHHDTARTLARMLKIAGFEVKTANTTASALSLAATEQFDILLSDIGLPDASGYELMKQIRALHGMQGIALSGYGMEEDMRKSRAAGFSDHIVKPVNLAHLEAVIRRVAAK
jgi:PAS domain S-box-containing protein